MSTKGANQNSKGNLGKLVEYINSKSNPHEFANALLSLCKPRREHFTDRNEKPQVGI